MPDGILGNPGDEYIRWWLLRHCWVLASVDLPVEVFIVDALRHEPHATHFHVEAALAAIERVQPQRAYMTHVCHDLEYDETCARLPSGVELAYDGLRIELKL